MAAQECQSILVQNSWNEEAINLMAVTSNQIRPQEANFEALARALGYTNTEMAWASGVLNRFTWQRISKKQARR